MSPLPDLLRLALRNTLRQRGRTAVTLSAIAFGVIALILAGGFIKDTIDELGESMIHSQSGHLQISRRGFREQGARDPGAYLIQDSQTLRDSASSVAGVEAVMFRLSFSGLLNNGNTDWAIIGEGVEPAAEARLGTYINIAEGRQLTAEDPFGILVGAGVARALDLAPGDYVSLLTNTTYGAVNLIEFEVVGTFQTFSKDYDARAVRVPLAAAQELLGDAGVHVAVISLAETRDTARVAEDLEAAMSSSELQVSRWEDLNPFYRQTVQLYQQQFGFLVLVILFMVALSVGNTINSNTHERAAEFGTMAACGAPQREIHRLILLESAILGLGGALIGVVLGNALALLISKIGIPMPPPPNSDLGYISLIRTAWWITGLSFVVGLLSPVLAALRPARRAARGDVAEALRQAT